MSSGSDSDNRTSTERKQRGQKLLFAQLSTTFFPLYNYICRAKIQWQQKRIKKNLNKKEQNVTDIKFTALVPDKLIHSHTIHSNTLEKRIKHIRKGNRLLVSGYTLFFIIIFDIVENLKWPSPFLLWKIPFNIV